jgi:PTH1 family peptidyl-tRNA hydrolase
MPSPTHLIVGLGNPGNEYAGTRHNIGFMAVDAIATREGLPTFKSKFKGMITGKDYLLLKPQTFMNLSGESVGEAMRFHKLAPAQTVVFHDDLDLPPGEVRIKQGGGTGGHNGLKSIDAHIGPDYWRVRLGIGHPRNFINTGKILHELGEKPDPLRALGTTDLTEVFNTPNGNVTSYVLGRFAKADHEWLDLLLGTLAENIDLLLKGKTAEYIKRVSNKE